MPPALTPEASPFFAARYLWPINRAAVPGKPAVGAKAAAKKKIRKGVTRGIAYVKATFNNTMVTITDTNGETISWASAGTVGFKGAKKSTPFAAGRAAENAAQQARKHGMLEVEVKVKGPAPGASRPF